MGGGEGKRLEKAFHRKQKTLKRCSTLITRIMELKTMRYLYTSYKRSKYLKI